MRRKLIATLTVLVAALALAAPALGDGGWGAGPDQGVNSPIEP